MDKDMRARLFEEHRLIRDILANIGTIAQTLDGRELRSLGRERRRLAGVFLGHFGWMDAEVYPVLLRRCAFSDQPAIARLQAEGRDIAQDYRTHLADWNAANLMNDWDGYRKMSLQRIARIKGHFREREQTLSPLMADGGMPVSGAA